MCSKSEAKVLNFYRGSTVLIAGGTGFLGKALLENILRNLQVRKVYLLIRRKRGVGAEERLEQLLEDRLFDGVQQYVEKIEPIEVDYDCSRFGLEDQLRDRLRKEVQVVFYCLATVRFNETLKKAVATNVWITRNMLTWCKSFSNLKSFVYTSTFYSNCNQSFVEEKVTRELPFGNYEMCRDLMVILSEEDCEKIKPALLGDFPNTYTFSKKLSEIMIGDEFAKEMPVGIYRPPVVSATNCGPLAGWTDNFFGFSAFIRGNLTGVKTVVLGDMSKGGNFAPVDHCVNAMLLCGYDVALRNAAHRCNNRQEGSVTVYNHHSKKNNCTIGEAMRYSGNAGNSFLQRFMWKYLYIATTNLRIFGLLFYLSFLLATIRDLLVNWLGKAKSSNRYYYRRSAQQLGAFNRSVEFAMTRSWESDSTNLRQLKRHLSGKEADTFYFELEDINWRKYFENYVDGVSQLMEDRAKSCKLKNKSGN